MKWLRELICVYSSIRAKKTDTRQKNEEWRDRKKRGGRVRKKWNQNGAVNGCPFLQLVIVHHVIVAATYDHLAVSRVGRLAFLVLSRRLHLCD